MRAGSKTLLFGTHNFIIHPIFVFIAWIIRYRSLPDLSEFIAICLHDVGLWGLPNLDGEEGEMHPQRIGNWLRCISMKFSDGTVIATRWQNIFEKAAQIVYGHSRFYAMKYDLKLSKLFQADKLAVGLYPSWLYIFLGTLSGEIDEYMIKAENGKYKVSGQFGKVDKLTWFLDLKSRLTIMGLDRDVEKYMQNKNHWQ